jgi:hypothetical protein
MKSFFTWFFNLLKSNKLLMQLAVQSITGEYFAKYPSAKAPVQQAVTKTLAGISTFSGSLSALSQTIKDNIKITGVTPETQVLALALIDLIAPQVQDYLSKKTLTATQQTAQIVEILGWINDIAKV